MKAKTPFYQLRADTETNEKPMLTQKELQKRFNDLHFNITQGEISRLESSVDIVPKRYVLDAYKKLFNVTTDYLLGYSESKKDIDFEKLSISTHLGLTEKAINNIKQFDKEDLIILNYLLESKNFCYLLIPHIADLFCINSELSTKPFPKNLRNDDYDFSLWNLSRIFTSLLDDMVYKRTSDYINSSNTAFAEKMKYQKSISKKKGGGSNE